MSAPSVRASTAAHSWRAKYAPPSASTCRIAACNDDGSNAAGGGRDSAASACRCSDTMPSSSPSLPCPAHTTLPVASRPSSNAGV